MNDIITIGVIGLGNAGAPILNNLNQSNRYKLVAFDIDSQKLNNVPNAIIKANSIKNIAEQCNVVLTCLPKPEHVLDVVDGEKGLLQNASTGMVWIDTSTTNFKQSQKLALKAKKYGADYVAFGAFFKSFTKKTNFKANLEILRWAKKKINIPCVAIGGINSSNYKKILSNGANFVACSNYIWNNKKLDPVSAINKFK